MYCGNELMPAPKPEPQPEHKPEHKPEPDIQPTPEPKPRKTPMVIVALLAIIAILAGILIFEVLPAKKQAYDKPSREMGYMKWNCVWLGSYPQAEVIPSTSDYTLNKSVRDDDDYIVDSDLYNSLENATWTDNETIIAGEKYRRISIYDATDYIEDADSDCFQWKDEEYHYFKYQPIKWRILSVNDTEALVIADKALDCQQYNDARAEVTWEICTLRTYLNEKYYSLAFGSEEQSAIYTQTNDDKIIVLSEEEEYDTEISPARSIGTGKNDLSMRENRMIKSTTYAKAMGAWCSALDEGNCYWWLRSTGDATSFARTVDPQGSIPLLGGFVDDLGYGVRPAMTIDLSSVAVHPAGTVRADGKVKETPYK